MIKIKNQTKKIAELLDQLIFSGTENDLNNLKVFQKMINISSIPKL